MGHYDSLGPDEREFSSWLSIMRPSKRCEWTNSKWTLEVIGKKLLIVKNGLQNIVCLCK